MRTLVNWEPWAALAQLDREFDAIVTRATSAERGSADFAPTVTAAVEGDDLALLVDLPGVDIEHDLELTVESGRLVISGRRAELVTAESQGRRLVVDEVRRGAFRREFALPEHITADAVTASYDRGVLSIRVAGISEPKPAPRRIAVTVG